MNQKTPSKGPSKPLTPAQARAARLKAALKANMGRRKQQARVRSADKPDEKGQ